MSLLREWHRRDCTCSWCKSHQYAAPGSLGLVLPLDKAWNAWRVLYLVTQRGVWYLRWTGFWKETP